MQTQTEKGQDLRDAYRRKYNHEIAEWETKLQAIKTDAGKCSHEAQSKLQPAIDAAERAFNAARVKWDQLAMQTEDGLQELEADVEREWVDVKAKIQGAWDAIKEHHHKS